MAPRVNSKRPRKGGKRPRYAAYNGVDLISNIPQCILLTIISLLPIKDAGRTSILSKRFRNLWSLAPLNLDDSEFCTPKNKKWRLYSCMTKRVWAITRILDTHQGPVRRFCLTHGHFDRTEPFVEHWLHIVSKKGVKELDLRFLSNSERDLPDCLLKCNSIETLRFANYNMTSKSIVSPAFTGVTELTLIKVFVNEEDLERMISTLESLRSFCIDYPYIESSGITKLHVRSRSLISFTVFHAILVKEICILEAPKLERFLLGPETSTKTSVKISGAPNLRMFGYIRMPVYMFLFDDILVKGFQVMSAFVRSLTTLAISVMFDSQFEAQAVARLLQCFPCIQTLHIQSIPCQMGSDFLMYEEDEEEQVERLAHLTEVVVRGYEGRRGEIEFIQYLLAEARVLREVRFYGSRNKRDWTSEVENELKNRDSGIKLTYTKSTKYPECKIKADASNFFLSDPFEA